MTVPRRKARTSSSNRDFIALELCRPFSSYNGCNHNLALISSRFLILHIADPFCHPCLFGTVSPPDLDNQDERFSAIFDHFRWHFRSTRVSSVVTAGAAGKTWASLDLERVVPYFLAVISARITDVHLSPTKNHAGELRMYSAVLVHFGLMISHRKGLTSS